MIHRAFIGLAIAGLALAVLEIVFYVHRPRPLRRLITPNYLVDYFLCAFNMIVVGSLAGLGLAVMYGCFQHYLPWLDFRLLDGQPMVLQCIVTYLAVDFISYFSHWVRHRVEWLWLFHVTHHSQQEMNPLTNLRSHPVDQIVKRLFDFVPLFMLGGAPEYWFWFGVVDGLWGYFTHADVRISLGPLRYIFVSPQFHRIHHSVERQHWNKNFGDRLVIWDYLFGTQYVGCDEYPNTGIEGYPVRDDSYHPWQIVRNLFVHMIYPFQMLCRYVHERFAAAQPHVEPADEVLV